MTPTTQPNTSRAAWLATLLVELPMPAADGSPLACRVKPIPPIRLAKCLKRLPGAFEAPKEGEAEDQGLPEPQDAHSIMEEIDTIAEQLDEFRPTMRAIIEAGVVEPLISFDDKPEGDAVPWDEIHIKNQVAMFKAVLAASSYANGGATDTVAGFRLPKSRGNVRGLGSLRRGASRPAQAVRSVPVPGRGRGGRKGKR